jgi:hypothetical protein
MNFRCGIVVNRLSGVSAEIDRQIKAIGCVVPAGGSAGRQRRPSRQEKGIGQKSVVCRRPTLAVA